VRKRTASSPSSTSRRGSGRQAADPAGSCEPEAARRPACARCATRKPVLQFYLAPARRPSGPTEQSLPHLLRDGST
jgi:hypothetical protein